MDLDLSAIGGGAGVLAFVGTAITGGLALWRRRETRKAEEIKKQAAEVKRDVAIAPALLQRTETLERQKDDITGQFHRAKEERDAKARELDGCEQARAACEKTATELRAERDQDRERAGRERQLLHDALGVMADEVDHLRAALERAPGPYRATGETMAERMRRTLSTPALPAYRSTPPEGIPRSPDATQPEMPGFEDDRWEPPGDED